MDLENLFNTLDKVIEGQRAVLTTSRGLTLGYVLVRGIRHGGILTVADSSAHKPINKAVDSLGTVYVRTSKKAKGLSIFDQRRV